MVKYNFIYEIDKMSEFKTIEMSELKRMTEQGRVLVKCCYEFTNDFLFDLSNKFGYTDYRPAKVVGISEKYEREEGFLYIYSLYFSWPFAKCIDHGNGNVKFYVHNNLNYEIKFI